MTDSQQPPIGSSNLSRRGALFGAIGLIVAGCARVPGPGVPSISTEPNQTKGPSGEASPTKPPTSAPSSSEPSPEPPRPQPTAPPTANSKPLKSRTEIVSEFSNRTPTKFGIFLPGVAKRVKNGVALTFDACGGGRLGNGFDKDLINRLIKIEVPATLFLNGRWIKANRGIATDLAANPLFELANHGWQHRPLTVRGQAAYGIKGTKSVGAAYDELVRGQDTLAEITGVRSAFFRPGTAWCDDVGVAIAKSLGIKIVAFSINVDLGASASTTVVANNLAKVGTRDLTLAHFNRPEGHTAEGIAKALPRLLDAGVDFRRLSQALR